MTRPTTLPSTPVSEGHEALKKDRAAAYLSIAPRTLDDWRCAGIIPCIERPGYVRFLKSDLDDFLLRHRKEARKATPYHPRKVKDSSLSQ